MLMQIALPNSVLPNVGFAHLGLWLLHTIHSASVRSKECSPQQSICRKAWMATFADAPATDLS